MKNMESMIKNLYSVDKLCGCTEDEIAFVKEMFGDLQILYGANSEESYKNLMTVMEGIGEEM